FSHLIRYYDFHEKRMAKQAELNKKKGTGQGEIRPVWNNVQRLNHQHKFVPTAVLTKIGRFPVNAAKQNFSSQAVSTSTARKVNTVRPIVNETRPRNNYYKSHSPIRRPFYKTTTPRTNFPNHKVNTAGDKAVSAVGGKGKTAVKTSAGCNWRPKKYYWNKFSKYNGGSNSRKCVDFEDPLGRPKIIHKRLKNKRIVDSGCSRHMTGNKAYLAEYQDYNGSPVAFGGSKCYITGKGKIRTEKLDFEDVCFVKELQHFNLFSVSQMCDKKNKVLFTDTECLVMSSDFKLPDEHCFNLENIVPTGDLACLIEKDTVDESNKWHRRLRIKREYSNARTPQQNGKRKNMTLIEAARIMLADSFLHNTFWVEVVSTACYVLNRVLVTKPQNKTPYELITGKGPNWLFDLDYLTDSMNYQPVTAENKANKTAGLKEANHSTEAKNGDEKPNGDTGLKTNEEQKDQEDQAFLEELERLKRQEKEANDAAKAFRKEFAQCTKDLLLQAGAARATSTNTVNTVSTPISNASPSRVFSAGVPDLPSNDQDDSQIHVLEEIYDNPSDGIFTNASYDDEGAMADFTNLETTVNVSPIPTLRIYFIHPTTQILRDPTLPVQTRSKGTKSSRTHAFVSYIQKQRRNNNKDF
ncbi:ribonuclease H-like domain-containing protein, partial [Tanacetum coccineum]